MQRNGKTTPLPSAEELLALFQYRADGTLFWKWRESAAPGWNERYAGTAAGYPDALGRLRVSIHGIRCRAHRIIFKMHHDFEPGLVDHINGNASDNRIENLRAATHQQNQANRRCDRELPKGVTKLDQGFSAMIKHNGASTYLGTFDTEAEAAAAYAGAARVLFGAFARVA